MKSEYVSLLQESCAFMPCYIQGEGKSTKVYMKGGGHEFIKHSVNKLLNDYFAIYLRSLENTKKLCGKITGRKNLMPLYIRENIMFIPIKTVRPFTTGDNCVGYINAQHIIEINFSKSIIILESGGTIHYLDRGETVRKRLGDSELLRKSFLNKSLSEFI